MQCKLDVIVLTKTKETICYYETFGYDGQNTLNTVTNDLMHVSVPTEKDHNSQQLSHMPMKDQHFCAHSCS
jgi:hypothetical protein